VIRGRVGVVSGMRTSSGPTCGRETGGAGAKPWGWPLRLSGMSGMSRVATWVAMAVVVGSLAAGCGSGPAGRPAGAAGPAIVHGVALIEPSVSPAPYGAADMAFGLDVLNAWCKQSPQANIVLSPASLASGLGMAYLGSGRSTARAMAGVLHLPAAGATLEAGLQARARALRALDGPGVTVSGDLTVRDRTRPVTFDARVSVVDSGEIWFDAEVQIDRANFGLTWNQMGMAGMHNTITVHAVFTKR